MRSTSLWLMLLVLFGSPAAANESGCVYKGMELRLADVIKPCTRALAEKTLSKQERAYFLLVRGRAYYSLYKFQEAYADYNAAIALTPNDVNILVARADVLRIGEPARELNDLNKAMALDPRSPRVLVALCGYKNRNDEFEEAVELCSKAISVDPDNTFAYMKRMEAFTVLGDLPRALADADATVRSSQKVNDREDPNFFWEDRPRDVRAAALIKRAEVLQKAGKRERALQDFNAAVAVVRDAYTLTRRAQATEGAAAIGDLQEALQQEPRNSTALYTLGLHLMGAQQFETALNAFERAIEIRPAYAYAYWMRAKTYRALGQPDVAFDDMMKAIAIDNRILTQTIPAMHSAGYWNAEVSQKMTPALMDAIRACMVDVKCN